MKFSTLITVISAGVVLAVPHHHQYEGRDLNLRGDDGKGGPNIKTTTTTSTPKPSVSTVYSTYTTLPVTQVCDQVLWFVRSPKDDPSIDDNVLMIPLVDRDGVSICRFLRRR
jgi:hypothetical protein